MTIFLKVHTWTGLDTFQNCHLSINYNFRNCHWLINDNFRNCHWSMTILKTVIDQWHIWKLSLNNDIFCKGSYMDRSCYLSKLSLIDQWQFWKVTRPVHVWTFTENVIVQWQFSNVSLINDSFQNCHWSMTVSKIVIDQSMTISKIVIDR